MKRWPSPRRHGRNGAAAAITRLGKRHCYELLHVGDKPIPVGLRQDIIERTDGIPLFVEEMTKAVLEAARFTPSTNPTQRHNQT
jgi:predicted ATPase